jgi:hypothetical protein
MPAVRLSASGAPKPPQPAPLTLSLPVRLLPSQFNLCGPRLPELAESMHVADVDFAPYLSLMGWSSLFASMLSGLLADRGHDVIVISLVVQVGGTTLDTSHDRPPGAAHPERTQEPLK